VIGLLQSEFPPCPVDGFVGTWLVIVSPFASAFNPAPGPEAQRRALAMVSLHRAVAIAMADGPLDGGPHPSAASASAWGQSPTCEGSTATPWIPNCTTPWLAFCTGLGYTLVALDGSGGWSSIR